jgi:hypothetical protein
VARKSKAIRAKASQAHKKSLVAPRRTQAGVAFGLASAVVATLAGAWWIGTRQSSAPLSTAAMAANPEADLSMLRGRWRRSDGGYVLEIKAVAASGAMEAAYFNPKPIHVATARASETSGGRRVFVELRDANYPGSTYDLTYDPKDDRLKGVYFQAVARETYGVTFSRLNP